MSDFVQKPLNKRMNRQNPVSRIEKVERAVGPGPSASVESLSDLSTESGIIRGDLILAPASGVETEEVTSTDYTGVFMSGDGKTFNGEDWNFGGVSAGVLQAGFSALTGKLLAGTGVVVLDVNGITIDGGTGDANRIKFSETDGSELVIYESVSSAFVAVEAGATNPEATLDLSATSGVKTVTFVLVAPETDKNYAEIRNAEFRFNQLKDDFDFIFSGDTVTNLFFGDAGLDAIGIGGVPASGSILEVNSTLASKATKIYGTNSTPIIETNPANNSLKIRGEPAWIPLQKLTTETRQSDGAALANDAELLFDVVAGKKYNIRGKIFFDTTAAADFKYRFVGPSSGPTLFRAVISHIVPGTATRVTSVETGLPTTTNSVAGGGTTMGYVEIDCIHHNDADSTFRFQWAQNTSTAANTSVLAGSYLEYCILE